MSSNGQIAQSVVSALRNYYSQYTGDEVEAALQLAHDIMPFLDSNIVVPEAVLTGDFTSTVVTTLTKDMWLESVTLRCNKPFSASSSEISYEVAANHATIVSIPNELMRDENAQLTYYIGRTYATGTVFTLNCSSVRAYGELFVKLNFA